MAGRVRRARSGSRSCSVQLVDELVEQAVRGAVRQVHRHPVGVRAVPPRRSGSATSAGRAPHRDPLQQRLLDQLRQLVPATLRVSGPGLRLDLAVALASRTRAGTPGSRSRSPTAHGTRRPRPPSRPRRVRCTRSARAAPPTRTASGPCGRAPRSTATMVCSVKNRSEVTGMTASPSATSAAIAHIFGPSPPTTTGGGPHSLGGGVNTGVISVWVRNGPR